MVFRGVEHFLGRREAHRAFAVRSLDRRYWFSKVMVNVKLTILGKLPYNLHDAHDAGFLAIRVVEESFVSGVHGS